MEKKKSLLPYVLINISVSILTVFLILFLWDRAHPTTRIIKSTQEVETQIIVGSTPDLQGPKAVIDSSESDVTIDGVFGTGELNLEYILIRNDSDKILNMEGWKVRSSSDLYIFPNLSLNRNGAVKLYSKQGNNSVIELFWGNTNSIWKPGDKILLEDPNGELRATYLIP